MNLHMKRRTRKMYIHKQIMVTEFTFHNTSIFKNNFFFMKEKNIKLGFIKVRSTISAHTYSRHKFTSSRIKTRNNSRLLWVHLLPSNQQPALWSLKVCVVQSNSLTVAFMLALPRVQVSQCLVITYCAWYKVN